MIIINILIFICFFILYFFRESYFSELAISFLPYIWGFLLFVVLYWIIQLWKNLYNKPIYKNLKLKYSPFFLIWFWILFWLYANELNSFYNQNFLEDETLSSPIKIFYSNIYKENYNYEAIKDSIQKENPDVVMFVEFSDEHEDNLKRFINEKYPYYDKTNRSRIFWGSVVMSKYPITNFFNQYKQDGSRRYGYFMIKKDNIPYYFYLIHTSSPVTNFDYQKRNQQLTTIKKDFYTQHEEQRETESKIIMLGDFNVSPRSIFYKKFAESFPSFKNITRSQKIFFSWNLSEMLKIHKDFEFLPKRFRNNIGYFPLLWSHIDQIFVSNSVKVSNFKKIHIAWSDHDWVVFEIE